MHYFDINTILSYNKLFNFIVGERSVGKTYGALNHVLNRNIKYGEEFIYLRRYSTELAPDKLFTPITINEPNKEVIYKNNAFNMNSKVIGYTQSLTKVLTKASVAYPKVSWIIFDEFLLGGGQYHRYLKKEVEEYFLHYYVTVSRYREVKVLFLANAYSIDNPYFNYFDISFTNNSNIFKSKEIIAMKLDEEIFRNEIKESRVGSFLSTTNYGKFAIDNQFKLDDNTFIRQKTSSAKYHFDITFHKERYGVWYDNYYGVYFVTIKNSVHGAHSINYVLTDDRNEDEILVLNTDGIFPLKHMGKLYRYGRVFFENIHIKKLLGSEMLKW